MKVSKEYWVTNEHLDKINKNEETAVIIRNKDESSFNDSVTSKAINKITITYEVDRKAVVTESQFEGYLQEWDLNTPSIKVTDYLKKRIFEGNSNE